MQGIAVIAHIRIGWDGLRFVLFRELYVVVCDARVNMRQCLLQLLSEVCAGDRHTLYIFSAVLRMIGG